MAVWDTIEPRQRLKGQVRFFRLACSLELGRSAADSGLAFECLVRGTNPLGGLLGGLGWLERLECVLRQCRLPHDLNHVCSLIENY
jgi:hypothetical protein